MKVGNLLYFAPGIGFDEVDLDGDKLPEQFGRRIAGFYIDPAEECVSRKHAFAAGVLLVSCVDALARFRFGGKGGERFIQFAREELHSFRGDGLAERFYKEFRNGLVHESRLKKGGQFSLEIGSTVQRLGEILLINPEYLAAEVRAALRSYRDRLAREDTERARLADKLRQDHAEDFRVVTAEPSRWSDPRRGRSSA